MRTDNGVPPILAGRTGLGVVSGRTGAGGAVRGTPARAPVTVTSP